MHLVETMVIPIRGFTSDKILREDVAVSRMKDRILGKAKHENYIGRKSR